MNILQNDVIESGSWWDDTTSFFGNLIDQTGSAVGQYYDNWLNDEFGSTSQPQTTVETAQAPNADVSNSPSAIAGFGTPQIMIGVALLLGVVLLARK